MPNTIGNLQPGSIWERDGNRYVIVQSENLRMKDANDAGWKSAVSYQESSMDGPVDVRSQDDFLAKFRLAGPVE